jgi:hypothetical protein
MRVALLTTASKKEPFGQMLDRVRQAFLDAGLAEPSIRFNFGDPLVPGFVSSVDRVLKRYPALERFVTDAEPMPGIAGARRISNGPLSPAAGETLPYETLQAIAAGVPRSFPFHNVCDRRAWPAHNRAPLISRPEYGEPISASSARFTFRFAPAFIPFTAHARSSGGHALLPRQHGAKRGLQSSRRDRLPQHGDAKPGRARGDHPAILGREE